MSSDKLWNKYCSFYDKSFQEQMEHSIKILEKCFSKWTKTDIAKMLGTSFKRFEDVPVTTYADYPMMHSFGQKLADTTAATPHTNTESLSDYYLRIGKQVSSSLDKYMTEPFYFCSTTTGSTGRNKWVAAGKTFWENFSQATLSTILISCSDDWGETKLKEGDTALNITAPVPYISGWGADIFQTHFKLLPPMDLTDKIKNMKDKFQYVLKAIEKGKKLDVAGGIGSSS